MRGTRSTGRVDTPWALRALVRAPFTAQAMRELVFCLVGFLFALTVLAFPFGLFAVLFAVGGLVRSRSGEGLPAVAPGILIAALLLLSTLLVVATSIGRAVGALHRMLGARLLGDDITPPAPRRFSGGLVRRTGTLISDGVGWRGLAYGVLKLPLGLLEGYGVLCWSAGLVNASYPFWWRLFRNHPANVQLSSVTVVTPLGTFQVSTFAETFAALGAGVAMVLAAPWLARGASTLDRAAIRRLLGPGRLAQRVQQLQESRSHAVDEAAATLRRLERDLHDGAQIRLATLAMNLGMATEKLGPAGPPPDLAEARDLVATAHRGAKEALAELRDLVRGIHPPVLDNGLADALATLASGSPIPTTLRVNLPARPRPAIETIAYFCTAELLANAAKHSCANHVDVDVLQRGDTLVVRVADDGIGGAAVGLGSGLTGLSQRVSTVDGRLDVASPAGGPTMVTVELPVRA